MKYARESSFPGFFIGAEGFFIVILSEAKNLTYVKLLMSRFFGLWPQNDRVNEFNPISPKIFSASLPTTQSG